jgi:hypothetical protein
MGDDSVTVVLGPALRSWLDALEGELDADRIERIWQALEKQASIRERNDTNRGRKYQATVAQLAWRWIFVPFLAAAAF